MSIATTDTDYLFNTGDGKLFMYYKPTTGLTFNATNQLRIDPIISTPYRTFEAWIYYPSGVGVHNYIFSNWHDSASYSQSVRINESGNGYTATRIG